MDRISLGTRLTNEYIVITQCEPAPLNIISLAFFTVNRGIDNIFIFTKRQQEILCMAVPFQKFLLLITHSILNVIVSVCRLPNKWRTCTSGDKYNNSTLGLYQWVFDFQNIDCSLFLFSFRIYLKTFAFKNAAMRSSAISVGAICFFDNTEKHGRDN